MIAGLASGFCAALYMVFVVFAPAEGAWAPLGARARELPLDFFLRRRLYALEAWLCFSALGIYLALTEFRGRRPLASRRED